MKLRELKEARNDVIASNAKKIFIKTFVKQMSSALGRAVQSGTVESPVAAPSAPAAASAPETPEQKRIRLQRAAQQNADQTGAPFSRIPARTPDVPKTPEQIRQEKQAAATKTAQAGMTDKPTAAAPKTPEQIRQEKQAAATKTAQAGMTAKPAADPNAEGGKNDQDKTDARLAAAGMSPEEIAKDRAKREARVAARSTQVATTPKPTTKPAIDPALNPLHNPRLNPIANPTLNPTANPRLNPIANPRLNPIANPTTPSSPTSPEAPKFKGPKINGLQLRNMGESKKFNRLNKLFESIINIDEDDQATPNKKSLSDLIIEYFVKDLNRPEIFTPSNPEIWNQIKAKADAIAKSYPNMSAGLEDLANFGWDTANSTKATGTQQVATPPNATGSQQATGQSGETAAPAEVQQSKVGVRQINKLIPTLRKRDLLSVKKNVDNTLAGRGGSATAAPTPGNSAFGQMANQLSSPKASTSSTGGTTTTTPTGKVHTAAKTRVPSQTTETPPAAKNNVVKMPKGKVRASKEGGVTPEEQAKFDEKVRQAMAAQSK